MKKFKHIVIIDDDEITNFLNKDFLENFGWSSSIDTFCKAEDGIVFLQKLSNLPDEPVLLLLDLRMPGMDGFDLLESLDLNPAIGSLYVIIVTSFLDPKSKSDISKYSLSGVIEKPLSANALLEILKEPTAFYKQVLKPVSGANQ